ncbi:MAG TPA: c-type cytochrome [Bryobacteraceae bacterium]|nr:c-type cytochrome [Bryobacteraceae bacterium]
MSRFKIGLAALLLAASAPAGAQTDVPEQAARGQELFLRTAKPKACANCHALAGQGTAVGPDLKMWARFPPRATATAITTQLTDKVVEVRPKAGAAFPALKIGESETSLTLFDLAAMSRREMARAEIGEIASNTKWKHPPGQEKYTAEQLADLVAFIRWAGAKDRKPVAPEDVQ